MNLYDTDIRYVMTEFEDGWSDYSNAFNHLSHLSVHQFESGMEYDHHLLCKNGLGIVVTAFSSVYTGSFFLDT